MMKSNIFLSGIAGTGMSSLAGLFNDCGYKVSGSDDNFYSPVDKILKKMNIELFEGYKKENIRKKTDFCILGNVLKRGNPEVEYVLNNKIKFYSMADALYKFFIKDKRSVVVAGTHGKTTISSFVSYMLEKSGLNPGYFIGGKPLNLNSNYKVGKGEFFISEGDEYETAFFDRSSKFLKYFPDDLILTSLEYDHIDFFKTKDLYEYAFKNLINQVPSNGMIIYNKDYRMNRDVIKGSFAKNISYGSEDADYLIKNIKMIKGESGYKFTVNNKGRNFNFETQLFGKYNIWNLTAGIIYGLNIGISVDELKNIVWEFQGVERRLNMIKAIGKTVFLEDFAHHHTAIKNVLESLREVYKEEKLVVLFEPGSYSIKQADFQDKLTDSFEKADEIRVKNPFNEIVDDKKLDFERFRNKLEAMGKKINIYNSFEDMKTSIKNLNFSNNQIVVLLSNKSFGGIPDFIKSLN